MKKLLLRLTSLFGLKNASISQTRTRNGLIHPRELLLAEVYSSGPTYAFAETTTGENVLLPGNVCIVDDELDWYAVRPGRKIALRAKPDSRGRGWVATLVLFVDDNPAAA